MNPRPRLLRLAVLFVLVGVLAGLWFRSSRPLVSAVPQAKADTIISSTSASSAPAPVSAQAPSAPTPAPIAAPAAPAPRFLTFSTPPRATTQAVENRWPSAAPLAQAQQTDPATPNLVQRVRIVRTDFKYPLLRVEETLRIDSTGAETLVSQTAMVADHVLVKLASTADAQLLGAKVSANGGSIRATKPASKVYLVTFANPLDVNGLPDAVEALQASAGFVAVAEPDFIVHTATVPNDASFAQLWGLHNTGQTGGTADADIDAPEAWETTTGSRSVVVGVIDTGIDHTHPDLVANMWTNPAEIAGNAIDDDGNGYVDDVRGWDFVNNDANPMDDNRHGTHCAGTIGGAGNNALGVAGVNWQVSLVGLKFLSAGGSGSTSDAVEAVAYANGLPIHLTSNSWGGGGFSQLLHDAIAAANTAGRLFIAAAGNSARNTDSTPNYPSGYDLPNIIAVAATDHADQLATFSNYGASSVDLAAPGVNTLSTTPGATYQTLSGTSMATPHVAGAAALLIAHRPSLTATDIKSALMASVDGIPALASKTLSGGRLNAHAALLALDNLLVSPSTAWSGSLPVGGQVPANPSGYTLRNLSASPRDWSAAFNAPWAELAASSGTVPANSSTTVALSLIASSVQALPAGTHTGQLKITDVASGHVHTRVLTLTVTPPAVFTFDLASDPGWPRTGQWAFGKPAGLGGGSFGSPDPSAGHTGNNVLGVNLSGNYATTVGGPHTLTAGPFNFTGYAATRLQFRRWLNSDYEPFVSTTVELSTNGTTWRTLWRNGSAFVTESAWSLQDIDLSAYADNQPAVYLRWTYTVASSGAWPLSGWNIDDIAILGAPPKSVRFDPLAAVSETAGSTNATLRLSPAPSAPLTVTFTSNSPATIPAPASITVPAGATSAAVPLSILDNTLLDGTRTVSITPSAAGYSPAALLVTVHDNESATLSLELPASATEGATATGRVTISDAPSSPISITLASTLPDAATIPATVVVPAGATQADFTLTFPDNTRIEGPRNVTVTASVSGWTSGQASVSVADNDARTLALSCIPGFAEGRGTVDAAGTVTLTGTLTAPLTVALASSAADQLSVPATVVIPAGATSVRFPVTLPDDDQQDGVQTVTVTATAATFTDAEATAPVADNDPASFAFENIPSPQYVGQAFSARITALDINGAPASGYTATATLSGKISTTPSSLLPAQTTAFTAGVWTGAVTALEAGDNWTATATASTSTGASNAFTVRVPVTQIINLANNDIIYDAGTNRIYASTPSGTLVPINPATGALDPAISVATTPATLLARATDGSRLWVVFDSNKQAAPVALPALTPGTAFSFGTSSDGQTVANDIVTLPGMPNRLIVSRNDSPSSGYLEDVAAYENGVRLPNVTGYTIDAYSIEAGGASGRVFGYDNRSTGHQIYRLQVGDTGVSSLDSGEDLVSGFSTTIHADGDLLAGSDGRVIDGETYRLLATLPYSGVVRPDQNAKRVYLLSDQGGGLRRLRAYDTERFSEIGAADVAGVSGTPSQLIRVGTGGLAFRTPTQVFLLNTTLVPTTDSANLQVTQLATPNPAVVGQPLNYLVTVRNLGGGPADSVVLTDTFTVGATPTRVVVSQGSVVTSPTQITSTLGSLAAGAEATLRFTINPAATGTVLNTAQAGATTGDPDTTNNISPLSVTVAAPTATNLRRASLGARDVAYDPASDRLLVTTASTATFSPNSLLRLTAKDFASLSADYIGNNPGRLKLTADGQYAYALLDGTISLARAPIVSGTSLPLNFAVNQKASPYGLPRAFDLIPVTGRPSALAVVRDTPSETVALYLDGVLQPVATAYYNGASVLADSPTSERIYGYNNRNTGFDFYKFDVLPNGISTATSKTDLLSRFGQSVLKRAGSLLYTNLGRVIDPEAMSVIADLGFSGPIEPSLDDQAFYILDGSTLRAYDLVTREPVGTLALGTLDGTPTNLVRAGGRSLAFTTTTGQLYVLDAPNVVPAPALRVVLPARITEGVGTAPGVGRVEIHRPAANDIAIQLTSSAPDVLDITRNILLPAGQTSVTFDITVTDNAGLNGTRSVAVTASTPADYTPKSATTLVDDDETATLSLTLPASISESGPSAQGTVTLSSPASAPVTVTLASSDTTEATVPTTAVIPAGSASATFSLSAVNDDLMDGPQSATITASVPNYTSGTASVQVTDDEARVITLSLPETVNEGSSYVTATLALSGKPVAPLVVTLVSSDTTELTTPTTYTVPAGVSSVSFYVNAPDDTLLDGAQSVTVTATAPGFTGATATTSVRDNDPASGSWAAISGPKTAGTAFTATLTVKTIDGLVASGFSGYATITATNASGSAALLNGPVSLYISNGTSSASISVLTAGADTRLHAQVSTLAPIQSDAFTVTSAAPARFVIAPLPASQFVGQSAAVSITAQDAHGNTNTAYTGSAALNAGPPPAFTGSGTTNYSAYPFYSYNTRASRAQVVYTPAEIGGAGALTSFALDIGKLPGKTLQNWTIRLKQIPSATISGWESSGWTTVYQGTLDPAAALLGWNEFPFTTPFDYDGTSHLLVDFSYNNVAIAYVADGTVRSTYTSSPRARYANSSSINAGDPLLWSGSTPSPSAGYYLPNLRVSRVSAVSVAPASTGAFTAGTWTGPVNFGAASNGPVTLQASQGSLFGQSNPFTVHPSSVLGVTPEDTFTLSGPRGGDFTGHARDYTLTNIGAESVSWTASTSAWLSLTPAEGTLAPGASATLTARPTAAASALPSGMHRAEIVFAIGDATHAVRLVELTATPSASLTVTPATGFAPNGLAGGPFTPATAAWTLSNTGDAPLAWTAAKTSAWAALSATEGTLAPGASATVTASLDASATTLPIGVYSDSISLTNVTNGQGSATRPATLTVRASTPPVVTLPPASVSVLPGDNATLQVTATSDNTPTFQWYRGVSGDTSAPVPGATGATLITPPAYVTTTFWTRISSSAGSTDSAAAQVTVLPVRSLNLLSTGSNINGELGDGTTFQRLTPLQIAAGVAHASFGYGFATFLKADGTLWTMGLNTYGQLGDGTTTQRSTPVHAASGVRQIAAGHYHTVFLKTDGTLWGMGTNTSGQLGAGAGHPVVNPVQIASDVVHATAGSGHTHFVKSDGTLWGLGANSSGQLGDGTTTSRSTAVLIATGVARVSAGANHTLFLKTDGSVWSMGYNFAGQLGDGSKLNRSTPVQAASGVAQISAGSHHSAFIKTDGTLWTMGDNSSGKIGNGSNYSQPTPVQVATGVLRVAAGHTHTLFTKADFSLWAMGSNFRGAFGDGTTTDRWIPWKVNTAIVDAAAGSASSLFLSHRPGFITQPASVSILSGQTATLSVTASGSGELSYQWYQGLSGNTASPVSGAIGSVFTTPPLTGTTPYWVRVASSFGSTDSVTATVTVNTPPALVTPPADTSVLPGRNAVLSVSASGGTLAYQWYRGASGDTSQPVPGASGPTVILQPLLATASFWVRISNVAASLDSPAAAVTLLPAAFDLKAMGSNAQGQLGNGVISTDPTPVPQSITSDVAQIAAGGAFSLILKSDGSLWSTGLNSSGQLGDGTLFNHSTPVQVASSVTQIAAGGAHAFFIKADRTLWAMGSNSYGQLGDGSTAPRRLIPVQITTGVAQVAAGSYHSLFLKTDGTLWSCGYNNRGQLGNGTTANRSTLAQIATGVAAISAGSNQTYFIKADATLWAAGENFNGQLGDGTITHRAVPVQVLANVAQVATQYCFSQFLKTDGTLWAVGANWHGQLGDGTTVDRYQPVQFATQVAQVATGNRFTAFVQTDAHLRATGQNTSGQLGDHTVIERHFPVPVAPGVVHVATGNEHALFLQTPAPVITRQPDSVTLTRGQSTTLSVETTGSAPLTYQWYLGATGDTSHPIADATSARFTTPALTTTTRYWVRVTHFTSTDSAVAVVTVLPPAPTLLSEPLITGGTGNTVAWSPVDDVAAYEVQAATTADFAHPLTSGWQTALVHTFPILTDGLTWHFRVRNRVVTYANDAWQQCSAAEFATGTGTSIDTSNYPGDVVLASAGVNLHETFDDAANWSATHFPDVSAGTFQLTTLANEPGPGTTPPLPINQDGDTEARLYGGSPHALTTVSFSDGSIDAYLAPANRNDLHYGALLLRASRNEGLLNAYGAVLLFFADGSVKADFSRIIDGSINGMNNWFYSDTTPFALAANENIRARFSVQGSTLTLQLWRVAVSNGAVTETPIPFNKGSTTLTATDHTHTAAGRAGLYAYTSNPSGTRTLFDDVTVTSTSAAYVPAGTLVSLPITPSPLNGWGHLAYTATRPAGTSLAIDVLNSSGDTVLAENLPHGTDLATLPALADQPSIRLRARLGTSQPLATPRLADWQVSWRSAIDTITTSLWSSHVSSIQDATAPVVSLTSSTTVFHPAYTPLGTAFDAHGLSSLTINSHPLASASDWTQPFTLTLGENVFTVVATDNATPANITTRQFTVTYALPLDTDTDGMPDDWEAAHGLSITSATGLNGPRGDPDGDGLPNLLEYASNTDPRSPDAHPPYSTRIETDDTGATRQIFTYRRLLVPGNLVYTVTTSTDLVTWTAPALTSADITLAPNPDGLTETVTLRLPATQSFVRLRVTTDQ